MIQIFPPTLITEMVTSAVKRWPTGASSVYIQLDDSQFTNPTKRVKISLRISRDGGATFPFQDAQTWRGGAKSRSGASPSLRLGPWIVNKIAVQPTHIQFMAEPLDGPVTVGLLGTAEEL